MKCDTPEIEEIVMNCDILTHAVLWPLWTDFGTNTHIKNSYKFDEPQFLCYYIMFPDEFLLIIDQQFIVIIIIIIKFMSVYNKIVIKKNLTHIWMHEWFWFSQKMGASIPFAVNIIIKFIIMNIHTTNKVFCAPTYINCG